MGVSRYLLEAVRRGLKPYHWLCILSCQGYWLNDLHMSKTMVEYSIVVCYIVYIFLDISTVAFKMGLISCNYFGLVLFKYVSNIL